MGVGMELRETGAVILSELKKRPSDMTLINDLFQVMRTLGAKDDVARQFNRYVRYHCQLMLRNLKSTEGQLSFAHDMLSRALFFASYYDFDAYCQRLEWNRPLESRFYIPRQRQLAPVVKEIQNLIDDKLDILSVSAPPGTGKTTIGIYFVSFLMGLYPNDSILMSGHSSTLTNGFYLGILSILLDPEYCWHEIFPEVILSRQNAKDQVIDLGQQSRIPTLTCRSIDGSLTGIARCSRLLYADDLVSGIEEAMNINRLDGLWNKFTNDLRSRKKEKCKELHIATRWSVHDVIGRLERNYTDNERAKFLVMPALDENEQSNFDYDYDVGFSTKYFLDMRSLMDEVSWRALYMNEPIEREGLLYHVNDLRTYYDLPKDDNGETISPDAIIAVADTKEKGKDYYFLPVAYVYGDDYYIEDCICSDAVSGNDERAVNILLKHKVQSARFESNSAGGRASDEVARLLKEVGGNTHITKKYSTKNKETRIIVHSEWVKQHCLFKDKTIIQPQSDYAKMIKFLTSYSQKGRNPFDDVPDGMAMLSDFAQSFHHSSLTVVKNPFMY